MRRFLFPEFRRRIIIRILQGALEPALEAGGYDRRRPLCDEEERAIRDCMQGDGERELLVRYQIPIKVKDMRTLRANTWLNDEVINMWLELLNVRTLAATQGVKRVHFFSTYFFAKLCDPSCAVPAYAEPFDLVSSDEDEHGGGGGGGSE